MRFKSSSSGHHLTDEQLLLFADGELSQKDAERVRAHLETCWTCRTRLDDLHTAIKAFIHFRKDFLLPTIPPPTKPWDGLEPKFDAIDETLARPPRLTQLRCAIGSSLATLWAYRYGVAAAALVLILVALLIRPKNPEVVSANELMIKARTAESVDLSKVAGPVIHQRLRIQRRSPMVAEQSLTLEIWNDIENARVREATEGWSHVSMTARASDQSRQGRHVYRLEASSNPTQPREGRHVAPDGAGDGLGTSGYKHVAPPELASQDEGQPASLGQMPTLLAELEQIYRANHMDWQQPLSANSYQSWRESVAQKDEQVKETLGTDGTRTFTLTTTSLTPAATEHIEEAALIVRASDWHPVAQHLRIKTNEGSREYELIELAYHVVSLDSLDPGIFALPSIATPSLPVAPLATPLPVASAISEAELDAAEMDVRMTLHRLGADLGDPIDIERGASGVIEVQGFANSVKRKTELIEELGKTPHVVVNIKTFEEAVAERPATSGGRSTPSSPSQVVADDRLPIQEQLTKYFTGRRRTAPSSDPTDAGASVRKDIERLCNQAVASSDSALSAAWALRRLAKRYPAEAVSKLSPQSRRQLESLVRDHVRTMSQHIESSRSLLMPVLAAILEGRPEFGKPAAGASPMMTNAEWPGFAESLFDIVNRADRLTRALFAGAGLPVEEDLNRSSSDVLRLPPAEKYVADLRVALARLEAELGKLEKHVAGEFLDQR